MAIMVCGKKNIENTLVVHSVGVLKVGKRMCKVLIGIILGI